MDIADRLLHIIIINKKIRWRLISITTLSKHPRRTCSRSCTPRRLEPAPRRPTSRRPPTRTSSRPTQRPLISQVYRPWATKHALVPKILWTIRLTMRPINLNSDRRRWLKQQLHNRFHLTYPSHNRSIIQSTSRTKRVMGTAWWTCSKCPRSRWVEAWWVRVALAA